MRLNSLFCLGKKGNYEKGKLAAGPRMGVGEEAVSVSEREREKKEEKKGRRKKKEGERRSGKGSSFSPLNTQRSARFPLLEVDVSFRVRWKATRYASEAFDAFGEP